MVQSYAQCTTCTIAKSGDYALDEWPIMANN